MASLDPSEYVAMGRRAILELLDEQHAAAWREIEARIADETWPSLPHHIDPNHLSTARIQLLREGRIDELQATSRGGREVSVVVPTGGRRQTAIAKAAQRKRLLLARYLGWASGTPTRKGVIGPAAERVTHASFQAAAPYGYRLIKPDGSPVDQLLGVPLRGPLDHAAVYLDMGDDGLPGQAVTVPVEVKNLRDWMYPSSPEPYQLLEKAAALQLARPEAAIMPVLICRRSHLTLFRMAKDLGFFIIETRRQFIAPHIDENLVAEIRSELGFIDLVRWDTADDLLVRRLTRTLPGYALDRSHRWADVAASQVSSAFGWIRTASTTPKRTRDVDVMRALAEDEGFLDNGGGW